VETPHSCSRCSSGDFVPPEAALAQLAGYRRFLERWLDVYEEMDSGLLAGESVYSRIALRHGIVRVRATLGWIDESVRILTATARTQEEPGRQR